MFVIVFLLRRVDQGAFVADSFIASIPFTELSKVFEQSINYSLH